MRVEIYYDADSCYFQPIIEGLIMNSGISLLVPLAEQLEPLIKEVYELGRVRGRKEVQEEITNSLGIKN